MKQVKVLLIITAVFSSFLSYAQIHSNYFLETQSRRHTLNAAFAPGHSYVALPVLGGVEVGLSANTGLNSFIFPNPNGAGFVFGLNDAISADRFLSAFDKNNSLQQNLNLNIFSLGFQRKKSKNFWSFDMMFHEELQGNMPYDFFRFLKTGMENTRSNEFDFKNISLYQTNYFSTGIGHSRQINDRLRIGANAKLLVGIAAAGLDFTKLNLSMSEDKITLDAEANAFFTSALNSYIEMTPNPDDPQGIPDFKLNVDYDFDRLTESPSVAAVRDLFAALNVKDALNYGFAFDVGATYKLFPRLDLALALNNIGHINWKAKNTFQANAYGYADFDGVVVDDMGMDSTYLENFLENMDYDFNFGKATENRKMAVPFDLKLSAEYSIFNNHKHDIRLGVLYHQYHSKHYNSSQLVGAVTLKPLSWIMLSGTADIFNPNFNKYGLGINFSPLNLNLFLASDFVFPKLNNQYVPIEPLQVNLLVGITGTFGKIKHKKEKEPERTL